VKNKTACKQYISDYALETSQKCIKSLANTG